MAGTVSRGSPRPRGLRITAVALLVTAVLVMLILALEVHRRRSLYWYDVTADYAYNFTQPDVQRVRGMLTDSSVILPGPVPPGYTAVAEVDLRSTVRGRLLEPSLRVGAGDACRQFFERGASGVRFVLLCGAASQGARSELPLYGSHLRWREGPLDVLLFPGALPLTGRILIVAPHADDAEIAAFGLYRNADAWIVTVTNGSYGGRVYEGLSTGTALDSLQADLRSLDAVSGALLAGLPPDRAIRLGYFTYSLGPMWRQPGEEIPNAVTGATDFSRWRQPQLPALAERHAASRWNSLVTDFEVLLRHIDPSVIVTPHPALDDNLDHVFATAALLEALGRIESGQPALLAYTNHHVLTEFYPFGPAGAATTLPPWFDSGTLFRGLHSVTTDSVTQLAKLFALGAMHDLRPPPRAVTRPPLAEALLRLRAAARTLVRDPAGELSYYRRALRANELFFVYGSDDRDELLDIVRAVAARRGNLSQASYKGTP